jgi:hypothetical protein
MFNIFIEHHFKRVLKQNCVYSFLAMTMHCTSNLLVKKIKKINPTIKKGKIIIFFIILGARPTFTPGPERDQLVF